ncbi:hypothetical protein JTE90_007076, partial [Oedothorax gibbosus]
NQNVTFPYSTHSPLQSDRSAICLREVDDPEKTRSPEKCPFDSSGGGSKHFSNISLRRRCLRFVPDRSTSCYKFKRAWHNFPTSVGSEEAFRPIEVQSFASLCKDGSKHSIPQFFGIVSFHAKRESVFN